MVHITVQGPSEEVQKINAHIFHFIWDNKGHDIYETEDGMLCAIDGVKISLHTKYENSG